MKVALVFSLLFYFTSLTCQTSFQWAKSFGGPNDDLTYSLATDHSNNIYLAGSFRYTSDFDPGNGTHNLTSGGNSLDMYISKLDSSGNLIWVKQISGSRDVSAYDIKLDSLGNIYAIGKFEGTVDFDPSIGTYNLTSGGSLSVNSFILKLDPNGDFIWAKQILGTTNNQLNTLEIGLNDNVYLGGTFWDTIYLGFDTLVSSGNSDGFIAKLNQTGSILWSHKIGGSSNDNILGLTKDLNNNIYLSANVSNGANLNPRGGQQPFTSSFGSSIIKLNSQDNFIWAKSISGSGTSIIRELSTDKNGDVVFIGTLNGQIDFNPSPTDTANLNSNGSTDFFVSKITNSGIFDWAITTGGLASEYGNSIITDEHNNIYTTGEFGGQVDFDPSSSTQNVNAIGPDAFISKYDSFGNLLWVKQHGGFAANTGHKLVIDKQGALIGLGTFAGSVDFDSGPGTYNLNSSGGLDNYIVKYSTSQLVGVKNRRNHLKLSLSKNPSEGYFTLNLNSQLDVSIRLFDITGRLILSQDNLSKEVSFFIDGKAGMYFLEVSNKHFNETLKLIKTN